MYKAIIVDDEIIVRNAIKTMIPWSKSGVELVGTASNGIKALELVKQKNLDIIITDIKMPMMDGIEMIHHLKEQEFNGEIVVLSNYDDLELVKKALKSGVFDYVLKLTVQTKDFERLFSDIIQKLYQKNKKVKSLSNNSISNFEQRREEIISNLYVSPHHYDQLIKELNNLEERKYNQSIFSLIIRPLGLDGKNLKDILENVSSEIFIGSNWRVIVEPEPCIFFVTVSFNRILDSDDPVKFSERISNLLYMYYDVTALIIYSQVFTHLNVLRQIVEKGKNKVELTFYQFQKTRCMSGSEEIVEETKKVNCLVESFFDGHWKERLVEDENYLNQWFRSLIELAKEERLVPIHLKKLIIRIIWHVERELNVVDWFADKHEAHQNNLLEEQDILDSRNEEELIQLLLEFNKKLNGYLVIERSGIERKEVVLAMNFIKENLSAKLTISEIANYVNLSEAYLSKVFKTETGKSIISYVNTLRMQKAYHLLQQGHYLVKEVAWEVGIDDPFYFNRLFKKEFGISPKQIKMEKDKSTS